MNKNEERNVTSCDLCGKEYYQDTLINFDPGSDDDEKRNKIKEKFLDFDGMACGDCYKEKISKNNSDY